jgi:hypothetical protein
MRKFIVLFAVALAVFAGTAYANFCARDVVPAATLLVPYAAVGHSLGIPDAAKPTTLFSITNVSQAATIVHVTLWDAKSNPELDFDVLLSGYDTWQVNFRDVMLGRFDLFDTAATAFTGNRQPFEWGPNGRDANEPGSWPNAGVLPLAQNRNVAPLTSCANPPYGDLSSLSSAIVTKFVDVLIPHVHNGCTEPIRPDRTSWTTALANDPIFFYATADVVDACSTLFPSSTGYWTGPGDFRNVIIGDVIYFDPSNNYSEMMSAVHIEADIDWTDPLRTFYGRYNNTTFNAGPDFREPLATAFAFRYVDEAPTFASNVLVWKNKTEFITVSGVQRVNDCGRYLYYAWDHNEHSLSRTAEGGPSGFDFFDRDPNQFPFETQSVALTAAQFDLYATLDAGANNIGWMLLVFPPSYGFVPTDTADAFNADTQAWVGTTFKYNIGGNKFSAGTEAATMANAHCFLTQTLPGLGVNYNYNQMTGPVE